MQTAFEWVEEAIGMIQDEHFGKVRMYGSATSGLSLKNSSDIDLTLEYTGSRTYVNVLRQVRQALEDCNKGNK